MPTGSTFSLPNAPADGAWPGDAVETYETNILGFQNKMILADYLYNSFRWDYVPSLDKKRTVREPTGKTRRVEKGELCWTECEYVTASYTDQHWVLEQYYEQRKIDKTLRDYYDFILGLGGVAAGAMGGAAPVVAGVEASIDGMAVAAGATTAAGASGAVLGEALGLAAYAYGWFALGTYVVRESFLSETEVLNRGWRSVKTVTVPILTGKSAPDWQVCSEVKPCREVTYTPSGDHQPDSPGTTPTPPDAPPKPPSLPPLAPSPSGPALPAVPPSPAPGSDQLPPRAESRAASPVVLFGGLTAIIVAVLVLLLLLGQLGSKPSATGTPPASATPAPPTATAPPPSASPSPAGTTSGGVTTTPTPVAPTATPAPTPVAAYQLPHDPQNAQLAFANGTGGCAGAPKHFQSVGQFTQPTNQALQLRMSNGHMDSGTVDGSGAFDLAGVNPTDTWQGQLGQTRGQATYSVTSSGCTETYGVTITFQ